MGEAGGRPVSRRQVARRRSRYVRQEAWRYRRLGEGWRRPRGIDSKMRLHVKGWPKSPDTGSRTPRTLRHLHSSGYRDVLIHNVKELEGLNPKTDAARVAGSVGKRRRDEILARARELGVKVLNP